MFCFPFWQRKKKWHLPAAKNISVIQVFKGGVKNNSAFAVKKKKNTPVQLFNRFYNRLAFEQLDLNNSKWEGKHSQVKVEQINPM